MCQAEQVNDDDALALTALLLAASRALIDGISTGTAARGFDDIRPAHGFAFTLLSRGGATVTELAEHLGVTRQAAGQLTDELVLKGYVERRPHPVDARARLIVLTARGWACTRAADEAARDTVRPWAAALGDERLHALRLGLERIAPGGPLRPVW
jgi:DNA-binding MarR family transcriptional regulator